MYLQVFKLRNWLIILLIPLLTISGCRVRLAGAYDEKVDESIQKIARELSTLLVTVENNLDDKKLKENKYENFRASYISILAEVQILDVRTRSLPKYEKMTQMVVALRQNIKDLEALHKIGFSNKAVVQSAHTLIETSLIGVLSAQNALKRQQAD
jgi:hypothetical protein